MSKKSEARSSARGAAKAAGGAHLTKQARLGTLTRLFQHLEHFGFQVAGPGALREKHVVHYIESRLAEGKSLRTLQNEAAHIRSAMRAVGRHQAADSVSICNAALRISGTDRSGTKTAATPEQYQAAIAAASAIDPGLVAVLKLERTLGLRAAEAVRCGPSLSSWERDLRAGKPVTIIHGTKGGRRRDSEPANRLLALEAVSEARSVADARGAKLIGCPDLRAAMTWYRNIMHRAISPLAGITGHCLRYAYAADRLAAYEGSGEARREALAQTSIDLGHGDGRGQYVQAVYTR
ncbi:integrase domain-containing protein [Novilysobacter spongiicola]|uniref:Phage integrase, N-terminal n=1 Tax=Lysobacter spongiicola DSM 21749 TaxID=1122188 RepID=A0A1T4PS04_9GAMM|nr:integrase domain-containing protein [Lysobacter spongiicola]SJZ94209.1 Phage integrase, N-terminal [Lysobacter spongiicola DSM 21749]